MKITLNGQEKELSHSINLKALIEQFCKDNRHVIAEVNGTIVKNQDWPNQAIASGDTIELINFVGGG